MSAQIDTLEGIAASVGDGAPSILTPRSSLLL
jgi:hypothetical protein